MADVRVDVDLDTKKATQEAESFKGKMTNVFGDIAKTAAGVALGVGITKIPGFLMDTAKAAMEEEAAVRRMNQTFQNYADMAGASEGTFQALNNLLDERIEIGQHLAFTDDEIRDSFNMLLTATDDSTEAWKRQNAAMDLARGAGISLEQASKLLGKVSAENVEVFKRMGITIGENATEADALAAVQARFGGQAEAYAKSTAGQFEQTQIRMAELKEQIGMQLLPIMTKIGTILVEDVIPKLEQFGAYWETNISPKIAKFWEDTKPKLEAIWKYIQEVVMPAVQENFAKFQAYYESDIKPALENIKAGIVEVVAFLRQHWGEIEGVVRPIFLAVELLFKNLVTSIGIGIDIIGGDWDEAWEKIKTKFDTDINIMKLLFDAWVAGMKLQATAIEGIFNAMNQAIIAGVSAAVQASIEAIIGLINRAIELYNKLPLAPNISTISTGGGSSGEILNGDRLFPKTAPSILPTYPGVPSGIGSQTQQIILQVDGAVLAQVVTNELARAM